MIPLNLHCKHLRCCVCALEVIALHSSVACRRTSVHACMLQLHFVPVVRVLPVREAKVVELHLVRGAHQICPPALSSPIAAFSTARSVGTLPCARRQFELGTTLRCRAARTCSSLQKQCAPPALEGRCQPL